MPLPPPLRWKNVEVIPLVHGRVAFAVAVRERMLSKRHAALAVELPPSVRAAILKGLDLLPKVHAAVYRDWTRSEFDGAPWSPEREARGHDDDVSAATGLRAWYVPIDPCDAIVEALRIARGERVPVHFVDAEVEDFAGRRFVMPDPHALLTLGVDEFWFAALPTIQREHPPTPEDHLRERHMAARLAVLAQANEQRGDVLFLCGMAHWERIRQHLVDGSGALHSGCGPAADDVGLAPVHPASLFHVLGEIPFVTWAWEQHRNSIDLARHDQILAIKELVLATRDLYRKEEGDSLEQPTPAALATLFDFLRKLVVGRNRLTPDLYSMVVAAKGVIGNDFALTLLNVAAHYPPNSLEPESGERKTPAAAPADEPYDGPAAGLLFEATGERARIGDAVARITTRAPGDWRTLKRVRLHDKPPKIDRERWRSVWNPHASCSWPPEDILIENLRAYVSNRTLSLAGIDRVRTEEFSSSLKDGLAIRETLRDLPLGKIHVKIEPRVPGKVGAVVLVFEEDDAGTRFPLRMTWMAEHQQESTLAFYATDPLADLVGPGIGRARYGGCMFLFPPIAIPDIWDDLRFEKARRPSERLLLAALFHAKDRFVAYVAAKPPRPELVATAKRLRHHIVHLPLSTFSARTLARLRRVHVLNGQVVRSWAARFIR
ncbi:MAG: hypothetical protein EXR73_00465 [Myxococcales bacterium]|nr:hypothetical protein [Myxococcales bacterium]